VESRSERFGEQNVIQLNSNAKQTKGKKNDGFLLREQEDDRYVSACIYLEGLEIS
jgi:hypothetical protein